MISIVVISKDEPFLADTLAALAGERAALERRGQQVEVLVVDASAGRLGDIQRAHPDVRWIDFERPSGVRVSIAHQRNAGVRASRGDLIVFTDAGCIPQSGWLSALTDLVLAGQERVVVGGTQSKRAGFRLYSAAGDKAPSYLHECSTINVALARQVFDAVGDFDESFRYGSDVDFSWRVVDAGFRLRSVPDAVVEVDWGDWRRQLRRSYAYGRARVRLYRKHTSRRRSILRNDPVLVVWPLFIVGLPIALWHPSYLLLLAIPAVRNRHVDPVRVIVDHFAFALGALAELSGT